ncbi:MAG TPA: hypothetical protein VN829_22635 [Dongiaceae bacterium]|nr:hypothetical protein [Dongiaceae bacterium]
MRFPGDPNGVVLRERLAWQVGGDAGSFVVPKSIDNQMDQAQPPPVIP